MTEKFASVNKFTGRASGICSSLLSVAEAVSTTNSAENHSSASAVVRRRRSIPQPRVRRAAAHPGLAKKDSNPRCAARPGAVVLNACGVIGAICKLATMCRYLWAEPVAHVIRASEITYASACCTLWRSFSKPVLATTLASCFQ